MSHSSVHIPIFGPDVAPKRPAARPPSAPVAHRWDARRALPLAIAILATLLLVRALWPVAPGALHWLLGVMTGPPL